MSLGRRRLGRGLEALLGSSGDEEGQGNLVQIPLGAIGPNPFQPRAALDENTLAQLAQSIKSAGLLQPVVLRPAGANRYELVAGERRWRAVQHLGWKTIPAVVRDIDDRTLLTLALIENLQRDNLSPIEEARGYELLRSEFGLGQQDIADAVGRNRSTIANALRLLKLPTVIQDLLDDGSLSVGHARALLGVGNADLIARLAQSAVARGWSVREVERRARGAKAEVPRGRATKLRSHTAAEVRPVQEALERRLQTDVRVVARGERGRVEISYYSNEDLARLLELMLGEPFR